MKRWHGLIWAAACIGWLWNCYRMARDHSETVCWDGAFMRGCEAHAMFLAFPAIMLLISFVPLVLLGALERKR